MHAEIVGTAWVTPHLRRLVLGGGGLASYAAREETDAYVNIALPPPGAPYSGVFDVEAVKAEHDRQWWPARRRYSVRRWDAAAGELTLDFVVHGDEGVAGPWAASAEVGDVLVLEGPGGGYRPDPSADWHLMVGDESALPAIAASLEVLPRDAAVVLRLLTDGAADEVELDGPAGMDLQWRHREDAADPTTLLLDAVRGADLPHGRVHAFVHGEAEEIRGIRKHLLLERGFSRSDMSCSPYWRRTMTDEAWRAVKRDFVAQMQDDVPEAAGD